MLVFAALFFGTIIIISIVSSILHFFLLLLILNIVNVLLCAVLGLFEQYLILFIVVFVASLLPITMIQNLLAESSIAAFMIEQTPILSEQIKTLWFEHMINS